MEDNKPNAEENVEDQQPPVPEKESVGSKPSKESLPSKVLSHDEKVSVDEVKKPEEERESKLSKPSLQSELSKEPFVDIEAIISETNSILDKNREFLHIQWTEMTMMLYLIHSTEESLLDYLEVIEKLETFFEHHDILQAESMCKHYSHLPSYGGYLKALKDSPKPIKLPETTSPVPEADVKQLVNKLVDNFYDGGTQVKIAWKTCKNNKNLLDERKGTVELMLSLCQDWYSLLEKIQVNNIRNIEKTTEIECFMKYFNMKMYPDSFILKLPLMSKIKHLQ